MKEQIILIKFSYLVREIEQFIRQIVVINLEKYGINDRNCNRN